MRSNRKTYGDGNPRASHAADAASGAQPNSEPSEPDGLKVLLTQVRELFEFFSYYIAAKRDRVKLSLRTVLVSAAVGLLCVITLGGLVIAATWYLVSGMAGGFAELFGDRPWAGNLATGVLILAGLGTAIYVLVARLRAVTKIRTVQKYEQRQTRQQAKFGRGVSDQATASEKN